MTTKEHLKIKKEKEKAGYHLVALEMHEEMTDDAKW